MFTTIRNDPTLVSSLKPVNEFAKQLMAWSAIAMLFLQPLSLTGNDCGCASNVRTTATASCCSLKQAAKSCCGVVEKTCCSKNDKVTTTTCTCGDQCRCSKGKPVQPVPAVPAKESQREHTQTLALPNSLLPSVVSSSENTICLLSRSDFRPALTAQQTCVLLSRFIV